jgi:hypothetical protein
MANVLTKTQPWLFDELLRTIEQEVDEEDEDDDMEMDSHLAHWVRADTDLLTPETQSTTDRRIVLSDSRHYIDALLTKEAIKRFYKYVCVLVDDDIY